MRDEAPCHEHGGVLAPRRYASIRAAAGTIGDNFVLAAEAALTRRSEALGQPARRSPKQVQRTSKNSLAG